MQKSFDCLSRRHFLATGLAAAATPLAGQHASKTWLYTGCYTQRGRGIEVYEVNTTTGALTHAHTVQAGESPSFLAVHPTGKYVYVVNETAEFDRKQTGSVTAFAADLETGALTKLNVQASAGRGPAHISVEPSGKYVLVANYGGGTCAMLPVQPDGSLKPASDIANHTGSAGPNSRRQETAHAHMILPDLSGKYALSPDLGLDRVFVYKLDLDAGKLVDTGAPGTEEGGSGPRHLAFHPNGRFVFVINELASTLSSHHWNSADGSMPLVHTVPTVPDWFAGSNTTAHVMVSPDGRFVYGSNRGLNSIAIFSVNPATGRLTYTGEQWTFGDSPRNFNFDPSGRFLYAGNQNTDNIAIYRVDAATGKLRQTGKMVAAGQPVCFVFNGPKRAPRATKKAG